MKYASRKFLISVAAFLASVATSITALCTDNEVVAGIGITCAILSAAIYAACETYVDGKGVTQTTVTATTTTAEAAKKIAGVTDANE